MPSSPSLPAVSPAARRKAWLVWLGLTLMFAVSVTWRPPDEPTFITCPFRALTGLLCPGCGLTRAFCALGHGEFLRAIRFNPLSPFLYFMGLAAWISSLAVLLGNRRISAFWARLRPSPPALKLALVLVGLWWTARLVGGF